MGGLFDDLRCSVRALRKDRGHTAAVMLILACGIGIVTSVFTVYSALFLRPLPLDDPDRLLVVTRQDPSGDFYLLDGGSWTFLRDHGHPFEALAAATDERATTSVGGRSESVRVLSVAGDYFGVLRRAPEHGRAFRPDEGTAGSDAVILGPALARRIFGSAAGAVGGAVSLNGRSRFVVGVMAEDFARFSGAEAWIPGDPAAGGDGGGSARHLVLGRLRPDVDAAAAQARLDVAGGAFLRQAPERERRFVRFHARGYQDFLAGDYRGVLLLLLTAAGLVLLVSCVNGASLVLARGLARRNEFVTRVVLGAGRWKIVRLVLTENLLLAGGSAVLGCALAAAGVRGFLLLDAGRLASWQVAVDERVLLFALAVAGLSGVACGVAPALRCAGTDLQGALRAQDRGADARRQAPWLRRGLVVGQMAASFVLVALAVLFLRATLDAARVDPGFDSRNVLTAEMSLAGREFDGPERAGVFFAEGVRRLRAVAGIEAAAVVSSTPGRRSLNLPHALSPGADEADVVTVDWRYVTPGYFRTMRIPHRRGRDFNRFDRDGAPAVAIVNEAFAARYHPGGEALGVAAGAAAAGDVAARLGGHGAGRPAARRRGSGRRRRRVQRPAGVAAGAAAAGALPAAVTFPGAPGNAAARRQPAHGGGVPRLRGFYRFSACDIQWLCLETETCRRRPRRSPPARPISRAPWCRAVSGRCRLINCDESFLSTSIVRLSRP